MKVRVSREAEQEISEAAAYYLRDAPAVVAGFLGEVDEALARIGKRPLSYAQVGGRVRGCILGRFPFTLIYRVVGDEIDVLALAHQRRRPGYWRDR